MPKLKTKGMGMPEIPESECPDGPTIFKEMAFDHEPSFWDDARLKTLVVYLKGNTNLKLPEKWRQVIPSHI